MHTFKFKTNINCKGCVAGIQHAMDNHVDIKKWAVDTHSPDKILEVLGTITETEIIDMIQRLGYEIKPVSKGFFGKFLGGKIIF